MQRREFTKLLGSGAALPAWAPASQSLKAAVITEHDGAHLNYYCESLALTEEVASVALCDSSGESAAVARKLLGHKFSNSYKDLSSMLRQEKPDLAVVSMAGATSPAAIDAALDAGCHILAEKPACVRAEDFERLSRKAKARNRHLVLALANRVDPVMLEARRIVGEGRIGKIYGMELHLIADQTRLTRPEYHQNWRAQKAQAGGGHLIWLGIHWLDLAMFVSGSRIQAVTGFTANAGGQPLDVEDSAVVAMRMESGAVGTLASGYYLDKGYHSHLKIWGSQGWLQVQKHTEEPLEWYSTVDANPRVRRWEQPKNAAGNVYPVFVRAVVRGCAGMDPMPLTGDDSLLALKAVFACYRAAETGRTQHVA